MTTVSAQATRDDDLAARGSHASQWMDQVLGGSYGTYRRAEVWTPPINIYEDGAGYRVVVDLGGIPAEEVHLEVTGTLLVLSGVRKTPMCRECAGKVHVHLMEIDHGPFKREVELPEDADPAEIEAEYRLGFLWIRIPRAT